MLVLEFFISMIVHPIALSVIIYIIMIELKRRKTSNARDSNATILNENIFQKLLNLWSLLTMLTSMITSISFILLKVSTICTVTFSFAPTCWRVSKYFLTFYQISRLQYCFYEKQIHSSKLGYSKWLFTAIYSIGVILMIYTITYFQIVLDVISLNNFGCDIALLKYYKLLVPIGVISYHVWDILVLSLYLYKVIQIHKMTNYSDGDIYKRVKLIMTKIIILTMLNEIFGLITAIIKPLLMPYRIRHLLYPFMFAFDYTMLAIIAFLMIEGNEKEYYKMIKILRKLKLCICCQSWITYSITNNEQTEKGTIKSETDGKSPQNLDQDVTVYDTRDIMSVEMRQMEYIDPSIKSIDIMSPQVMTA